MPKTLFLLQSWTATATTLGESCCLVMLREFCCYHVAMLFRCGRIVTLWLAHFLLGFVSSYRLSDAFAVALPMLIPANFAPGSGWFCMSVTVPPGRLR
jgi:hypothetical protein